MGAAVSTHSRVRSPVTKNYSDSRIGDVDEDQARPYPRRQDVAALASEQPLARGTTFHGLSRLPSLTSDDGPTPLRSSLAATQTGSTSHGAATPPNGKRPESSECCSRTLPARLEGLVASPPTPAALTRSDDAHRIEGLATQKESGGDGSPDDTGSLFSLQSASSDGGSGHGPAALTCPLWADTGDLSRQPRLLTPLRTGPPATLFPAASSDSPSATSKSMMADAATPDGRQGSAAPRQAPAAASEKSLKVMLNEALLSTSFDARCTDLPETRARLEEKVRAQVMDRGIAVLLPPSHGADTPHSRGDDPSAANAAVPHPPPTASDASLPGRGARHAGRDPSLPTSSMEASTATTTTTTTTRAAATANVTDNPLAMSITSATPVDAATDDLAQSVTLHLEEIKGARRSVVPRYFRGMTRPSASDTSSTDRSATTPKETPLLTPRKRVVSFNAYESREASATSFSCNGSDHRESDSAMLSSTDTDGAGYSDGRKDRGCWGAGTGVPRYVPDERMFLRAPHDEDSVSSSLPDSPTMPEEGDERRYPDGITAPSCSSTYTTSREHTPSGPSAPVALPHLSRVHCASWVLAPPTRCPSPGHSILVRNSSKALSSSYPPASPSLPTTATGGAGDPEAGHFPSAESSAKDTIQSQSVAPALSTPPVLTVLSAQSRYSVVVQVPPSGYHRTTPNGSPSSGLSARSPTDASSAAATDVTRSDNTYAQSSRPTSEVAATKLEEGASGPRGLSATGGGTPRSLQEPLAQQSDALGHIAPSTTACPLLLSPTRPRFVNPRTTSTVGHRSASSPTNLSSCSAPCSTAPALPPVRGGRLGVTLPLPAAAEERALTSSLPPPNLKSQASETQVTVYMPITPASVPHSAQLAKKASEDYLLFTQFRLGFLNSLAADDDDDDDG